MLIAIIFFGSQDSHCESIRGESPGVLMCVSGETRLYWDSRAGLARASLFQRNHHVGNDSMIFEGSSVIYTSQSLPHTS